MAHVEVGVGEAVGGGEGEGGCAPQGAHSQELCQGGLTEVWIHLGKCWEQVGWLGGALARDHPHIQG